MKTVVAPRLALLASAIVTIAACSNNDPGSSIAAPRSPSNIIGVASSQLIQVCVTAASPRGTYSFAISNQSGIVAGDVVAAPTVVVATAPGLACTDAFSRLSLPINNAVASLTITAPAFAGTVSYTCSDNITGSDPLCGSTSGTTVAVAQASSSHGSLVTFSFVPAPIVTVIGTPLFVIGDVELHSLGTNVNFWGAQWWKNNFMSGVVSNGVASFKGYASTADNFCGGTWTSRVGNSPPPPATIPDRINIIVTSTVLKNGPDISGNIVQILTVDQDGGYGPNPGHRGNGPVTSVLCR